MRAMLGQFLERPMLNHKQSFLPPDAEYSEAVTARDAENDTSPLVRRLRDTMGSDDAPPGCDGSPRGRAWIRTRLAIPAPSDRKATCCHRPLQRRDDVLSQPPPNALTSRTLALIRRIRISAAAKRADKASVLGHDDLQVRGQVPIWY